MKRGLSFYLVLLTFLLFLTPKLVKADDLTAPAVIFSEVGWAGSSNSASDEWFELKNVSAGTVDLTNWKIEVTGGSSPIDIVLTDEILPEQNLLYSRQSPGHLATSVVTALSEASTPIQSISRSLSLPNKNLKMVLTDNLDNIIDQAGDGSNNLAGTSMKRASMVRKLPITDGSLEESWYTANYSTGFIDGITDFGTPGLDNISLPISQNLDCLPNRLVLNQVNKISCSGDVLDYNDENMNVILTLAGQNYIVPVTNGHWTWEQSSLISQANNEVYIVVTNSAGSSKSTFSLMAYATSSRLVINELMSNPTSGEEWIELYNNGPGPIDLAGWSLDDLVTGGSKPYFFSNGQIISGYSYLVLPNSESKIILNNTGDEVSLSDPFGQMVSQAIYAKSTKGKSFARYNERAFLWDSLVTPGEINKFPPKIYYSNNIKINEFIPNPVGKDSDNEWIELKNTGTESVNLASWILDDGDGGSNKYTIAQDTQILPNSYLVLKRAQTNLALNNNHDEVRLFSPDSELKDSVDYANAKMGFSFAKVSDSWVWTNQSTVGGANLGSIQLAVVVKKTLKKTKPQSPGPPKLNNSKVIVTSTPIVYSDIVYKPIGQVKGASTQREWPFWLKVVDEFAILLFTILLLINIWLKLKQSKNSRNLLKNIHSP